MAGPKTLVDEGAFDANLRNAINTNFADTVSQSRAAAQTIASALTVNGALTIASALTVNGALTQGVGLAPTVYTGTTDAILFPSGVNLAIITPGTGTDACTLATPVAGDNGKLLYIINGTAGANTVTSASGKILDGTGTPKDTITFAAHIGCTTVLMAYNLLWQLISTEGGTLTAV